jgi:hypothetical protein
MQFGPIGKTAAQLSDGDATRWDLMGMLGSVVKELKKVVLHLSFMTDNSVKSEDVE